MGCCGAPGQKDDQHTNRPAPVPAGIVQQQPAPQAAAQIYEKPALLTPTIPSPPPPSFHTNQPPLHGGSGAAVVGSPSYWGPSSGSASVPGSPSPPPGSLHRMTLLSRPSMNASMPAMPPNAPFEVGPGAPPTPLYQPSPIHPLRRNGSTAPSLTPSMAHTVTSGGGHPYHAPSDESRLSISIDFGTTFSGVAYASARIASGTIQQILNWPGSFETFRKVPTCLLYDEHGHVLAWGLEAKNASLMPGTFRCEWFKLFLEPRALRDESAIDPRLPQLPPGKTAINLIVDFLTCLWEYAKEDITREIGAVADLNAADVVVTCPAAWDAKGCDLMRAAAIEAGLVQSARAGDIHWRDRLRIITEPEAAAVHCARLTDLHKLRPSQNFMICDAGGGTVDLACYKITGQVQQNGNLEIAEMCARSGANCGALFLDLRFRELVKTLLVDHPAHLDAASLAYFMHSFSQTDKLAFRGEIDDDTYFHFTCFNVQDPHDPSVGLINGELAIPGILIRREVFDPVVNQVLDMIEEQSRKIEQRIDALLLVGGFAGSEYLFRKVEASCDGMIKVIARPSDADTATLRGAAQYGLSRKTIVSTVIVPRAYIMKVKLPAEPEDWLKRPAYINENSANVAICENRLQYLVMKGSILRKGQRVKTKLCKFSQNRQDCHFVAVLYTSETDKMMRYTDEASAGETTELCKWTVDLSSLPTFQHNASISHRNGFYTEFELGLEMDSAEVRGVLFYEGQEWSRVVFDFLN
ncbi:actin-like ATPase domain-containing protein [Boletus edulis BED1]|uniref:Actin-like ATPase domain-containing protein n=1 Tax=Boletus edulis BED1 TaxID=1328754 RepID=A0AAD4GD90_BOLED|nr:actin-like ATPase domain-containing protein [Boletus edulis BED1]